MSKVSAIPSGYRAITPYLIMDDASKAIAFYKKSFGAIEIKRMDKPDGKVGHAELTIGDSKIMLADEYPEMNVRSANALGGSPMFLYLYVTDVDTMVTQAVTAGAQLIRPVEDTFYGDRQGTITDPFGYTWCIATHVEEVSDDEIKRRAKELFSC